jgi:WhiB family redox-sensing transcriptional regulator
VVDVIDLALAGAPWPGDWVRLGACRKLPSAVFFPEDGHGTAEARQICRACPVQGDCATYAVGVPGLRGVWGGLTEEERRDRRRPTPLPLDRSEVLEPTGAQAAAAGTLFAELERLMEHPGRWARVATFSARPSASSTATMLRSGVRRSPPGIWRFEGRRDDDGSVLWARYDGPLTRTGVEALFAREVQAAPG